jgi:hypothetical protein
MVSSGVFTLWAEDKKSATLQVAEALRRAKI